MQPAHGYTNNMGTTYILCYYVGRYRITENPWQNINRYNRNAIFCPPLGTHNNYYWTRADAWTWTTSELGCCVNEPSNFGRRKPKIRNENNINRGISFFNNTRHLTWNSIPRLFSSPLPPKSLLPLHADDRRHDTAYSRIKIIIRHYASIPYDWRTIFPWYTLYIVW